MDDIWLSVEDSISSLSSADSDNVDSEIEAELYGMVHHEDNSSLAAGHQNGEETMNNQTSEVTNPVDNVTNFVKLCRSDTHAKNSLNSDFPFCQNNFKRNSKNASTPLKRKSDSEQDSLSIVCSDESGVKNTNLISKQTSSNRIVNKKLNNNLPKKTKFFNEKSMVISDSNDSDESVIWTEPDSSVTKRDLKTNVFNDVETISISDSSDDEFVLSSPSRKKEIIKKNFSLPNIKIGERSTDLWYINEEDCYRSKNKSRRYHNSDFQCSNCGRKGHRAKSCPVSKIIKCFICGGSSHLGFECKNKVCNKCYNWGHNNKECRMNFGYCYHCSMKGHVKKNCPDIWRRYHLTTEPVRIVHGRNQIQDRTVYCFNCGWPGHHGAVCKKPRNPKNAMPTWPSVISYDDPDKFINSQKSGRNIFTTDIQNNQMQQPNERVEQTREREETQRMEQTCERVETQKTEQMYAILGTKRMEHPYKRTLQQPYERSAKSRKSRMQKKWEQFRQNKKLLREKDFPRTPQPKVEITQSQDAIPDCINIAMQNQIEKRKRNRSKRIRRRKKNTSENIFKTKVSMYRSTELYKK